MADIYLDNAAATPPAAIAVRAMARAQKTFGNPSSFNQEGRKAATLLASARARVARFLNARPDEIVFCASGSEANTLALLGVAAARGKRGALLAAKTEHLSVLASLKMLASAGQRVITIPVDEVGRIRTEDIISRLSPSVTIVSVMYANNEIGTVQPIAQIGRAIVQWRRERQSRFPLFHVDACQATTTLPVDVQRLCADTLTINGAKAYGPHGTAALYVRRGVEVQPRTLGGTQEGGRRAGTEDVAGAVGFAAALDAIRAGESRRIAALRDRLIKGIARNVPDAHLNGPLGDTRLAGNVNVSIPGCDSESLLLELDARGIHASAGSACTAHRVEPSHVLVAIGTPKRHLEGSLRFSLGRQTTQRQIDEVIRVFPAVVARVRARRA